MSPARPEPSASAPEPHRPAAPASLAHPAFLAAALVAAAAVCVSVSFRIFDFDLWEHLVVGKYLWTERSIPTRQLWTWPTYGAPAEIPSWLHRLLLWPFWHWGGVTGLFVWRWLTTLATFGLLFLAARAMGAGPFVTLPVLVLGSLGSRARTMARPETLAAVLLAVQIWLLESRRQRGTRRDLPLLAIAVLWINVHISFYLGLFNLAVHALDEAWARRRARRRTVSKREGRAGRRAHGAPARGRSGRPLGVVALACLAISLVNPFGWNALVQPFAFAFQHRGEPIYQTIGELSPIDWSINWKNGLPLLFVGWPVLLVLRWRKRGFDLVETATCAVLGGQALASQRFVGFFALAAVPYMARDLTGVLGALRRPVLAPSLPARAALAALAIVTLGWLEWTSPDIPLGVALENRAYPIAACDFIARAGIRGRAFNDLSLGGYMEYRFWPDRDRLPFMDGHLESATLRDRTLYAYGHANEESWRQLDRERRFDYLVLSPRPAAGNRLRDFIDADSSWAAVFADDAAVVYVRSSGPLAPVAERYAYRSVPTGPDGLRAMLHRCAADPSARPAVARELERQAASSPYHANAHGLLATLAALDNRRDDARRHLTEALGVDPLFPRGHERLGLLALEEGRPNEAMREFRLEYRLNGWTSGWDLRRGMVLQARGDLAGARAAYRRELARDASNDEARDSLASVERGLAGRR